MWILSTIGFFSIVAHRTDPGVYVVRGRVKKDLEVLRAEVNANRDLPRKSSRVLSTPKADYPFRFETDAHGFAYVMTILRREVTYPNFKNAVRSLQGPQRELLYHQVWSLLMQLEEPRKVKAKRQPKDAALKLGG